MSITIEAYGKLSELLPQPLTLPLDSPEPQRAAILTVADLMQQLALLYPRVAADLPRTAVARGPDVIGRDTEVAAGDRLALIPPVGGG